MEGVTHRFVETNGINMHIAEQGSGPIVLLLHGYPSIWYMWRRQMQALADAGYHAIAPDQRGYGQTKGPDAEDQYTVMHLVGDIIGLLDALGQQQVLVVGHDWGAIVGWWLCLLRPDRVKGYVSVAVPALPRLAGETDWLQQWKATLGEGFYICRFQEPGRVERDFASVGTEATLKAFTCAFWDIRKGEVQRNCVAPKDKELSTVFHTGELPSWYKEEDLKYCVEQFEKSGFTGPINWYRNLGRSYKLLAPWVGATISTKAYFITGEDCAVLKFPGISDLLQGPGFKQLVPNLRGSVYIKDAAHFVMEEQPEAFNENLLTFLADLQSNA
ncbi:hypothetical protein KC19_6G141500 [Ceratodon purpureus]|uniref:soluble epoxide hydrolase n=1 Tax=Ceratodon purpureus TaxID=3225 RepID=A0A8T0HEA2_CERPU|nr:hypothetical protein KC19_6G141500 [Ceratodon purpureus]